MEKQDQDQRTIVPVSMRVYSQDRELYKRIKEETALPTDAQVFAQLVQSFYDPIRVKDETADLQQQLATATDALQHLQDDYARMLDQMTDLKNANADLELQLNGARNQAAEEAGRLQLEYEAKAKALEEQNAPKPDQHLLTIPDDYYRALQLVAERESQRRGQQWTPSHVVSFFIYSRFIKGSLNGDLKSLSDSELRQAGIKTGGKVEL